MEDEGPVREALARALTAEGHEVRVARGAEEAHDRLGELGPNFIIFDAESSDAPGRAIGSLRSEAGHCRLIALTGGQRGGPSRAEPGVDGANYVLQRPTNLDELRRILREQ